METNKYISYDKLQKYDSLIKNKINVDDASILASSKSYTDSQIINLKNNLVNGAGTAYDTLLELGNLIDNNASAIDALEVIANGKANITHSHAISDITNLQTILNGKAASSHGTHVSYSTTAPVMDGTASVGSASTVARSDHKHPTDTSRAAQTSLDSHTSNTTLHITSTERTNWGTGYTHSQSAHAPSNAEPNQNAFSNVKVGSTTIAADSKTDTLTLVAGTNVTLTPDTNGDSITITAKDTNTTYSAGTGISLSGTTFSNSGVRSITTGTSNGTISVNTNGTAENIAVKGLGSAAYTSSTAYDTAGTAQTKADAALASAKAYADDIKDDLLNGAGTAYDTLKELGDLINVNVDAIDALETIAAGKANINDLTSHTSNKSNPHGVTLAQLGITATASELNKMDGITATTAELNKLDGVTATTTEINYLDGVTSGIQSQLDAKSSSSHTHKYAGSSSVGGAATSANKLNTDAGSATQPVYFSNGVPVATTYTLGKSVPSNAVFTDTNTHYTSKNVVGATNATSNTSSALSNGSVYLNSVENGTVTSSHKISGAGATTVTTDASGNIVITSTDNNTTYGAAGSSLGLVKSGGDVTISSGVITVNDDSHNHTIANIDNLQSSLDAKQATITGGASTITTSNLTSNRALVSNGSGKVDASSVTSTELGYLDGVTSNIQAQLDGKSETSHTHKYAGSTSVGGSATSAVKLDTDVVGDSNTPVYFSGGKPVACTSLDLNTSGSSASCTGNSATATKLQTARTIGIGTGATGTATSFNGTGNIIIPVTDIKESYLSWGGKNLSGSVSPIDAACSNIHNANRFAFAKPAGIIIEYSTNGSTYSTYNTTDAAKVNLVSGIGSTYYIGARSSSTTVNDKLRITLNATNMGLYTRLRKLLINISTGYSSGSNVIIEKAMKGSETTFSTVGTYNISGWSGWNSIPISAAFGGGNNQTGNIAVLRLTFGITGVNSEQTSNALTIMDIIGIGDTYWSYPSTMAKTGNIYTYDSSQNTTFPANVTATTFVGALSGNATTATTATKLGSSTVGGVTQPVYINNGTATACTYTLAKSVPSNAVFTDTNTKVTNTLATTTKAYVTGTTSASTNTGTQVFDTGVYLDTTAGQLTATSFNGTTYKGGGVATLAEVRDYLGI